MATHAPPSTQTSIPGSPRSSAPDNSARLSTAQSMADDDDEISIPQAAPASTSSSLTQVNLAVIAASAARSQLPSVSVSSQAGSMSTVNQQQKDEQSQPSSASLHDNMQAGASRTPPAPAAQRVSVHPLQSPAGQLAQAQSAATPPAAPQASPQEAAASAQPDQDQDINLTSTSFQPLTSRSAADSAFAAWLSASEHKEWVVVEYLASQVLPALVGVLRMVAPQTETEALRYSQALAAYNSRYLRNSVDFRSRQCTICVHLECVYAVLDNKGHAAGLFTQTRSGRGFPAQTALQVLLLCGTSTGVGCSIMQASSLFSSCAQCQSCDRMNITACL